MIPVNEPLLGEQEAKYITECLNTGWISSAGHFIEDFESKWANYCGMKFGIAVCNGTAALQVAMSCINLQPGDEVILPSFTIISCVLPIIEHGAIPVLVDCDPKTWCMDVNQIKAKITDRTRAIMPVHIYGHPVDMDPVLELAKTYNLLVIEDSAEAHGAEYLMNRGKRTEEWKKCGGMGDLSTFSFYANKLITTGEGGMVLTNDPELAEKARSYRNLCFLPERRFYHKELGYNFRMTNLQAALGLAQFERFDKILEKKRWMGLAYTERLKDITGLQLPIEESWARQVYWMYGLVVDEDRGMDATTFARRLDDLKIQTRPFFLGMHVQPVLTQKGLFSKEQYPVTDRIARQGLYIPSGLALTKSQMDEVCRAVRKVLS
jgi:perosamine synthetase